MSDDAADAAVAAMDGEAEAVMDPSAEGPPPSTASQASVRTVSGENVQLTQCAAVSVTGSQVTATDSAMMAVMAGEVTANDSMILLGKVGSLSGNATVLLDLKAAVAGAVVFALTLLALGRLFRRGGS